MKKTNLIFGVLLIILAFFLFQGTKTGKVLIYSKLYHISEETIQLIEELNNNQVDWSGSFIGIIPTRLHGATLLLRDTKENINPLLVAVLTDKNKFVAAHLLLTLRTSVPFRNDKDWNGLEIQISSDRGTTFDGNNLIGLQIQWIITLLSN